MSLADYINSAPKKAAPTKKKKVIEKMVDKPIEKVTEKAIAPIINIIEQPDYSPLVIEQSKSAAKLAIQAIAMMNDVIDNNSEVMAEIVAKLTVKPKEFLIVRDNKGDMIKIIPVYPDGR